MPCVRYGSDCFESGPGESVLDTLLRNGVTVPHSCRAGVCGSCLMRSAEGPVPARAQAGLKDSWKSRGYFLACSSVPEADVTVAPVDGDAKVAACIVDLARLSPDVLRVSLRCDGSFEHRAGQYVTVIRADGLSRSYSIASLPDETEIELHVRRTPNGRMSGWLFGEAQVGDRVSLIGPSGDCFYVAGRQEQPLLLVGTGTGLAPLYGVLRDALRHGHSGPIHLFHGAVRPAGLYLRDELRWLALQHANVVYTPTVLDGEGGEDIAVGAIDQTVLTQFPKLKGWRAFVCGDPGLVQMLRKKLFLNGIATRDIHADAFLPTPP